jgi:hypothetical protein
MSASMTRLFSGVLSLAAVLAIPTAALASTVTLNDYSGGNPDFTTNAPGGGGAFTATTVGGPLGNLSFITFCLEFSEHFSYGGTYNYTLSNGAIAGGVSGGNPDLVDDATKWLYYQVRTGGYSSIAAFGSPGDVGVRVQEAIWFIEGEKLAGEISVGSLSLANYAVANQTWNAISANGFTVYAMNLTNPDGTRAQDQMAMIATPEPATLLLLGTGLLSAARTLRRRKTRS